MSATEAVAPPKTVVDLLETDDAKALLDAGKEHGQLSADEIAVALDELELEPAQIDDFYHALEELHIEVVTGVEEEQEAVEEPREVSTDALQLFLKDIGKVDLLTAAQEVELVECDGDLVGTELPVFLPCVEQRLCIVRLEQVDDGLRWCDGLGCAHSVPPTWNRRLAMPHCASWPG